LVRTQTSRRIADTFDWIEAYQIMRLFHILLLSIICIGQAFAQTPTHADAKKLMAEGSMNAAARLLKHLHKANPNELEITKDLSIVLHYLKSDQKSWNYMRSVIKDSTADDQCFQIAVNALKVLNRKEDVVAYLRLGLDRFPQSGPLFNEMGNYLASQRSDSALWYWESGIRLDPAYARNYYYAAKYLAVSEDWLKAFLLGTYFLNLENSGEKHIEIKALVADAHKNWIEDLLKSDGTTQTLPVLHRLDKLARTQKSQLAQGNTTMDLIAFHVRLVFDWFNNNPDSISIKLLDHHRQLLREGHFESYMQWLLGASTNQVVFQRWYALNDRAYHAFKQYLQKHPFKAGNLSWIMK